MPRRYVRKPTKKIVKVNPAKRYTKKRMRMPRRIPTNPFPKVKNCTLLYKQPSITLTSGGVSGTILTRFRCNSLYDFDVDNNFLDKQPLYFDQLLSVTGPYKNYKVNAWKTTITVTNLTDRALQVYFDQGTVNSITDADTSTEVQNRQGVINKLITAQANAKPQLTFTSYRKLNSFVPKIANQATEYTGTYAADPTNLIISSLLLTNLDPASITVFQAQVSVTHTFYTTVFNYDSLNS